MNRSGFYLEKRIPALNQQRFYTITVTQTLFGSWAMVRAWGRIGHSGTVRERWLSTETEASTAGEQWRQRKEQRGYRIVSGTHLISDHPCRGHIAQTGNVSLLFSKDCAGKSHKRGC